MASVLYCLARAGPLLLALWRWSIVGSWLLGLTSILWFLHIFWLRKRPLIYMKLCHLEWFAGPLLLALWRWSIVGSWLLGLTSILWFLHIFWLRKRPLIYMKLCHLEWFVGFNLHEARFRWCPNSQILKRGETDRPKDKYNKQKDTDRHRQIVAKRLSYILVDALTAGVSSY